MLFAHIFIYMLAIAGQTARPNWLIYLGNPWRVPLPTSGTYETKKKVRLFLHIFSLRNKCKKGEKYYFEIFLLFRFLWNFLNVEKL